MATLSSINSSEIGREVRCGGEYRGMAREGRRAEEKEKRKGTICQLVQAIGESIASPTGRIRTYIQKRWTGNRT